jgi:hypothetical protein
MISKLRFQYYRWISLASALIALVALLLVPAPPLYAQAPAPGGVNTNLALWLRADAGTSASTDGQAVGAWVDQSPNGRTAAQETVACQPTYENGADDTLNFHPVLRFDGVDDTLAVAVGVLGTAPLDGVTVFVVQQNHGYAVGNLFDEPIANAEHGLRAYVAGDYNQVFCQWFSLPGYYYTLCPFAAVNTPHLWSSRFSDDWSHEVIHNGVSLASASPPPVSSVPALRGIGSDFRIGNFSGGVYRGEIAELIVYTRELTPAQRRSMESYPWSGTGDSIIATRPMTSSLLITLSLVYCKVLLSCSSA